MFKLDVKNAFHHNGLHEKVFMEQPMRTLLKKEYNLQTWEIMDLSPWVLFEKFFTVIANIAFQRCYSDHSVSFSVWLLELLFSLSIWTVFS